MSHRAAWSLMSALALSATASSVMACGSAAPVQESTTAAAVAPTKSNAQPADAAKSGASTATQTCVLSPVHFAYDSADLDERARQSLTREASCLAGMTNARASVVGMTDPRGTEEYNLALGERRAQSTARYLKALGVGDRVSTTSVGEEYATGTDERGWANDRRAQLERR